MQESHVEGIANHDDPEPCRGAREGAREAWDRGTCGPGIEPRNFYSRVPTVLSEPEGHTHQAAIARRGATLRGRRPRARTEPLCARTGRSPGRPLRDGGGTPWEGHAP